MLRFHARSQVSGLRFSISGLCGWVRIRVIRVIRGKKGRRIVGRVQVSDFRPQVFNFRSLRFGPSPFQVSGFRSQVSGFFLCALCELCVEDPICGWVGIRVIREIRGKKDWVTQILEPAMAATHRNVRSERRS